MASSAADKTVIALDVSTRDGQARGTKGAPPKLTKEIERRYGKEVHPANANDRANTSAIQC